MERAMTSPFQQLQARHEALLARQEEEDADLLDEVTAYLDRVRRESAAVTSPQERAQLRANLRYWSGYVYEQTGSYPSTELAPSGIDETKSIGKLIHARRDWATRLRRYLPLIVVGTLIILLLGAGAFVWFQRESSNATATAVAATTTAEWLAQIADADNDGLPDVEEAALGTDPNNPDTDGDGLSDGDERAYGSDPLVRDSDGDSLLDGEEVSQGTSPVNPDTDGDGLNDNVDPDPGQLPTLTPTPPPTETPTGTPTLTPTTTPTAQRQGELYIVQPGDTLADIAQRFDVSVEALADANNLELDGERFPSFQPEVGTQLIIPPSLIPVTGGGVTVPFPVVEISNLRDGDRVQGETTIHGIYRNLRPGWSIHILIQPISLGGQLFPANDSVLVSNGGTTGDWEIDITFTEPDQYNLLLVIATNNNTRELLSTTSDLTSFPERAILVPNITTIFVESPP
jgi:LysM repeat protein